MKQQFLSRYIARTNENTCPQKYWHATVHSTLTHNSLLLLLLSHFSRVLLCATPWTAAHQAPPSLGFSRQEQWSGLPFPSPMHESEKWKQSSSVVSYSCVRIFPTPWTAAYQAPPSMGFARQEYWSGVPSPSPIIARRGKLFRCPSTGKWINRMQYIH